MEKLTDSNILYIDGMDLSGKTTTATLLSEQTGMPVRKKYLTENNPFQANTPSATSLPLGSNERASHFLNLITYDIENYSPASTPTIQESLHITKGYAIDTVLGSSPSVLRKYEDLLSRHHNFAKTVFLTVAQDERVQRLNERRRSLSQTITQNDLRIVTDPKTFKKMEDAMLYVIRQTFSGEVLDTTRMAKHEVCNELTALFKGSAL
jgi:thymidylate kinase